MAIVLDPILQAAQDGLKHKPLIQLLSNAQVSDIPFDGQFLTDSVQAEFEPCVIVHSSGRILIAYCVTYGATGFVRYVYTDVDRTTFSAPVTVFEQQYETMFDVSMCEKTGGNIGVLYRHSNVGGTSYVKRLIISVLGAVVTAAATVFSYTTSGAYYDGPFVITKADGAFVMVYAKKSGSDYYLYSRTSADFITWGAETQLTIGGLTATKRIANPAIIKITTNQYWLFFDVLDASNSTGGEITNIYYSTSSDMSTWDDAVAITSYDTYTSKGKHPRMAQSGAGKLTIAYTEESASLHMNQLDLGWCLGSSIVRQMHLDDESRCLYVYVAASGGTYAVVKINVGTWLVENCWSTTTTPGFPSTTMFYLNAYPIQYADKNIIPVILNEGGHFSLAVLDGNNDTITNYFFHSYSGAGIAANVDHSSSDIVVHDGWWTANIMNATADAENNRVWVFLSGEKLNDVGNRVDCVAWGYIDLTEGGPTYTYHEEGIYETPTTYAIPGKYIHPDLSLVTFGRGYNPGEQYIWTMTGELLKHYTNTEYSTFHYSGFTNFCLTASGKLYGAFIYMTDHAQGERRGLLEINIDTDAMNYYRPSWAALDDYKINSIKAYSDGRILMASDYGVTIFNPSDLSWTLFDNTAMPGLTPSGTNQFYNISEPDEAAAMIYGHADGGGWAGVVGFSENGYLKQAKYIEGLYTDHWAWAAAVALTIGRADYDPAIGYDPLGGFYAFWVNQDVSSQELSIKWDRSISDFPLQDYLERGTDIKMTKHTLGNTPHELSFTLLHGELFDPYNILSLMRVNVEKGRKITYNLGEIVDDVEYLAQQLVVLVTDVSGMTYVRGESPRVTITCRDAREVWKDNVVRATDAYATDPKSLLEDLIPEHSVLSASDIDLPTFDNSTTLYAQWLDTALSQIVDEVCGRYGYYPTVDRLGKFTARKISDSNPVDHTYTDLDTLLSLSPDDSYSDFTNRIVVIGQERDYRQKLYPEERIKEISGTVGWWGGTQTYKIWYSEDKSRECLNPRLIKKQTVMSMGFKALGGVDEEISEIDTTENKYCVIKITVPNLTGELVAAIALILATYIEPDWTGLSETWLNRVRWFACMVALNVLGSTAQFQYEIMAVPVGHLRSNCQATWNDLPEQAKNGVIEKTYDESQLCYTVADCQVKADAEGLVTRLQRKRLKISKVTHLQDEEGDTIQVPHPVTGQLLKMFVTDLTRTVKIPKDPASNECSIIDNFEVWLL